MERTTGSTNAMTDPETAALRRKLSLSVLQRVDADVLDVVESTTFVSVYNLDESAKQWSRAEVEGFLYIVRRQSLPKYRLIVLNQRHTEDLIEDITSSWEISGEENYIFYRLPQINGSLPQKRRVSGLWFFEDDERLLIHNCIASLVAELRGVTNGLSKPHFSAERMLLNEEGASAGREILGLLRNYQHAPKVIPQPLEELSPLATAGNDRYQNNCSERKEIDPLSLLMSLQGEMPSSEASRSFKDDTGLIEESRNCAPAETVTITMGAFQSAIREVVASEDFTRLVWSRLTRKGKY